MKTLLLGLMKRRSSNFLAPIAIVLSMLPGPAAWAGDLCKEAVVMACRIKYAGIAFPVRSAINWDMMDTHRRLKKLSAAIGPLELQTVQDLLEMSPAARKALMTQRERYFRELSLIRVLDRVFSDDELAVDRWSNSVTGKEHSSCPYSFWQRREVMYGFVCEPPDYRLQDITLDAGSVKTLTYIFDDSASQMKIELCSSRTFSTKRTGTDLWLVKHLVRSCNTLVLPEKNLTRNPIDAATLGSMTPEIDGVPVLETLQGFSERELKRVCSTDDIRSKSGSRQQPQCAFGSQR